MSDFCVGVDYFHNLSVYLLLHRISGNTISFIIKKWRFGGSLCGKSYDKIANEVKDILKPIEAVFDRTVFHPESEVELKPNTRVEITVKVKTENEDLNKFRVRSKHLGFRNELNYDKTGGLLEEIEASGK